jgi:hypothetical protein
MAKQLGSQIVGTLGNLIFYKRNGIYLMRTKPTTVRRTSASVNSGKNFGKASKISMLIRSRIRNIYRTKLEQEIIYDFTGALNKYLNSREKENSSTHYISSGLPFIEGFQFNEQSDLSSISAIQAIIKKEDSGAMECHLSSFIPGQSLHAPGNTKTIKIKMMLLGASLSDIEVEMSGEAEIEIPYTSESFHPSVISFPLFNKSPDIILLVMAVQYMIVKGEAVEMLTNKKKLPCGIAWAGQNN